MDVQAYNVADQLRRLIGTDCLATLAIKVEMQLCLWLLGLDTARLLLSARHEVQSRVTTSRRLRGVSLEYTWPKLSPHRGVPSLMTHSHCTKQGDATFLASGGVNLAFQLKEK